MVVLALVGLIALVLAALTGSTPLAIVVIALAVAGIVQLVRDWRHEATPAPDAPGNSAAAGPDTSALSADEFAPDISTDPDGPSSNARVDHT